MGSATASGPPSCRRRGAAGLGLACCVGVLAAAAPIAGAANDGLRERLGRPEALRVEGRPLLARELQRFYRAREFAPVWGPDPDGAARVALLLETLARVEDHGLDPGDYHLGAIGRRAAPPTDRHAAEREILLTDALLRYAADVRTGRVSPTAVEADWGITLPRRPDPAAELAGALEGGTLAAWLSALPPPHAGYVGLTEVMRRYRAIAEDGGWRPIPAGPPIVPGQPDARVPLLRERLAMGEDLAPAAPDAPDEGPELGRAVRRFQARHHLEADGIVGPDTLRALNVPVTARIKQVALSLERWRWLPRDLGARHLVVNAAAATLTLVEAGRVVLSSRVVVGDALHPTPAVESRLSAVVFNPPWTVPTSIATEEFLPRLRANPRFLADNDMVILERLDTDPFGLAVDWPAIPADRFPFHLQQRPGPANPMGRIKFVSPNRFDVFLHDTPLPSLFERADRALSHGCVRVERARDLAAYVLAGRPGGSITAIERMMAAGATRAVPVLDPLPVYFAYWTAFTDEDGAAHFREDVYGRDDRLAAALARHARSRAGAGRTGGAHRAR